MLSERTDFNGEEEEENNQPISSTAEDEARLLATIVKQWPQLQTFQYLCLVPPPDKHPISMQPPMSQ
jgi:hypothetical protein